MHFLIYKSQKPNFPLNLSGVGEPAEGVLSKSFPKGRPSKVGDGTQVEDLTQIYEGNKAHNSYARPSCDSNQI